MLHLSLVPPPQVPPHLGNSTANAGISLARLLWFLTPRQAVTLVASLLLERRIILVARDAETVSAAVHAASALLYPFKWQHIYLPLLPLALKVGGDCAAALYRMQWQVQGRLRGYDTALSLPAFCVHLLSATRSTLASSTP
jgi:hypothetical protein